MRTKEINSYGWERPDIIHKNSIMWDSRLSFIVKELDFLNSMLNANIYPIVESHLIEKSEVLKEQLKDLKTEVSSLLTKIKMHINGVKILFDKSIKTEEDYNYKHEHRKIMIKMHEFDSSYQNLKKEIFKTVTEAWKHQKQKKLS
ncbi:hypothetical protein MKO06_13145 [Gramella sp. GC03-9]|uniref:Uncharacterized protein n=1 Tax=Christiangramia oceanisediminis TaxID=2920386 RepID=A0A9X2RCB0_9FLAO|nr:hypothetical protein [Gramella oceanisediminis]MCP9200860.1 hypothetical protein [Gramella oceanisediminis]